MDQVQTQSAVTSEGQQLSRLYRHLKSEKNSLTRSLINQKLLPDIISTIFTYCVPSARQLEHSFEHQYSLEYSPLQLGHICNYWREIAWSTPDLWNQLFMLIHSEQLGERAFLLADLACEWLDRSGDLPLSLYIRMEDDDTFYDSEEAFDHDHPMLEILKQYSRRWQNLNLRMWTPCITQLRLGITGIPILRTLKFWPIGVIQTRTLSWEFQITPRQVDFHVGDLGPSYPSMFFENVSWAHLVDITVTLFPCNYHIKILKSAPQLTRLTINDFVIGPPMEPIQPDQVIHFKLQSFKVIGYSESSLSSRGSDIAFHDFLSMLHFPSLQELHYSVGPYDRPTDHISPYPCPTDFFGRLNHLRSLSIQLSLSSEGTMYIDVLRDMPSLENLLLIDRDTISNVDNSPVMTESVEHPDPLLSLLAATYNNQETSHSSQPFLPVLRTFGYQARFQEPPWAAILSVVALSEIEGSHRRPLNTIAIEFGYSAKNLDAALVRRLAEVKGAGIDVILKVNDPETDFQQHDSILYLHNDY